jgi:hypothetical protein
VAGGCHGSMEPLVPFNASTSRGDVSLGCTRQEEVGGGDDGYVSSDLEVRCSDGTATVEECFGPGSDLNGNGIADINE